MIGSGGRSLKQPMAYARMKARYIKAKRGVAEQARSKIDTEEESKKMASSTRSHGGGASMLLLYSQVPGRKAYVLTDVTQ